MLKNFARSKIGAVVIALVVVVLFTIPSYLLQTAPFTYEEYKNIGMGMSAQEVSKELRNKGKILYENKRSDGTVVTAYTWTNPDGSYVEATFENDRLRRKSERGLSK
ncbi:hypothetical protein I532_03860 [Brevibacillus borstelensis AK1]|uniref:DUF3862 domain-containing protein n=1 Tax=Brevibacillus borstelensis AK1 TaxID=1300222 RepID=M8EGX5_9BACL|nr:hypothetical protein [Brevibacillus borstelensis]EMT54710.1 hypothetical protein I532_03860 [Brevibacillus borstelensis AK1]